MSAWLILTIVTIGSMPVVYGMARDRGRSTNAWLNTTLIFGPLALLVLLVLGRKTEKTAG